VPEILLIKNTNEVEKYIENNRQNLLTCACKGRIQEFLIRSRSARSLMEGWEAEAIFKITNVKLLAFFYRKYGSNGEKAGPGAIIRIDC